MRRQQVNNDGNQGSGFAVFRPPGARYTPSTTSSNGSSGGIGIPLSVGPSMDGSGAHRNSYTSTIPASPPYRESMPDGMGYDDYEGAESGGMNWMRTGRVVRVKETGQSFRFPLDSENLPQIELSRQDILQLRETMEAAIDRAVQQGGVSWMENPTMAPANTKFSWKVHLEKKNCIMYRRKNDSTVSKNFLIRCKLDCSLNDVMYGVMSDNTEDERTYLAHIHRDDFLDGAVLQLLARPNVDDPHQLFAVKWAAFQSPMDSMFAIRDMLFVEYSRTVVDPKGQKVVARVFQSIRSQDYNAVEREFHFVRVEINWIQLFRVLPGSNDSKVDVSLSGAIVFPNNANTPSWLANRFLASQYAIITGMGTAGDAKFIVNNQLVSEKPWVPNSERSACNVCFKSFSLLRHRHHCRICAEIMCTSCTLELSLRTTTLPPSLRPEGGLISAEKFCFKCVEQARRDREISLAHELALASAQDLEGMDGSDQYRRSSEPYPPPLMAGVPGSGGLALATPPAALLAQQELEYLAARGQHPKPRSASSHSSESSGGMQAAAWSSKVLSAMHKEQPATSTTWSNKVLTAMGKEKPPGSSSGSSDLIPLVAVASTSSSISSISSVQNSGPPPAGSHPAALRGRTHTAGPDRLRAAPLAHEKSLKNTHSLPTVLTPDDQLERPSEDVVTVAPMPSSFAKMEESIAAQQLLLRNMLMEGQKMMQQQQQYAPPPPRPQYAALRSSPQIDELDDVEEMRSDMRHLAVSPSTSETL